MDGTSLLSFLDTPFLVGDPEGRIVFVNPSFEERFCSDGEEFRGEEMATLFAGGGREAMLRAVAEVCDNGETVRFRMREDGRGYLGIASPIESSADRVGVVILLCDEPDLDERLAAVQQEIQEPLDEAKACLDQLIEQTGGRRSEAFRGAVERGLAAVVRARKWSLELTEALKGRTTEVPDDASFDPVRVARDVVGRAEPEFQAAGVSLDLLVPAQLPAVRGDGDLLETALVRLLRLRMATSEPGNGLTVAARMMAGGPERFVLMSVVDRPRRNGPDDEGDEREPRSLCEAVAPLGGSVQTVQIPDIGRGTAIRLPLALAV
jgi:hypothetical protein